MNTVHCILLAIGVTFMLAPLVLADRTPIPEKSINVHKITNLSELNTLFSSTTYVVIDL
ncbi:hypothetical protein BDV12DRAFT_203548 [Aspergillus spectabilis]